MSLEGLVKEIDEARKREQTRWMSLVREQYESIIRSKDEEISSLREEIETLRRWLDHAALPAVNPISKRPDSLDLIKLNFGKDRPCPDVWAPGEKDNLESIGRDNEMPTEKGPEIPGPPEAPADVPLPSLPEPPKPERPEPPGQRGRESREPLPAGPEPPEPPEPGEKPEAETRHREIILEPEPDETEAPERDDGQATPGPESQEAEPGPPETERSRIKTRIPGLRSRPRKARRRGRPRKAGRN
jgi:hypothetical protein